MLWFDNFFFWIFSVHILLYKSSLDYNSLLKLFESFKKSNFKTLNKFQISIVIQIGSIKQNVDRKNSKKFWDKKIVKMKLLIFKIITVQGSNFSIFCPNGPKLTTRPETFTKSILDIIRLKYITLSYRDRFRSYA